MDLTVHSHTDLMQGQHADSETGGGRVAGQPLEWGRAGGTGTDTIFRYADTRKCSAGRQEKGHHGEPSHRGGK